MATTRRVRKQQDLGTVTPSATGDATAIVTGLDVTLALGAVAATGDAIAPVTGLDLALTLGVVDASGDAIAPVTGSSYGERPARSPSIT